MTLPALGPKLPARGNRFSKGLGAWLLVRLGWRLAGDIPDVAKAVLIVVPHTSNWDFVVGVAAMLGLGLRISWLGKHTLFRAPLGRAMRWLGGVPVNRHKAAGVVEQSVVAFAQHEQFLLGLAPEGTRSKVTHWRRGFYHIALSAGVPILPVAFDYAQRTIVLGKLLHPSGRWDDDAATLADFYRCTIGKNPERATLTP